MNFDLTDDQRMLRDTAANFAKKESPVERFRKLRGDAVGFSPKVWKQMGELGWLSVPFSDEVGGFGGDMVDVSLILGELGRTLVPEPYIPSVVLGGMAIARAGSAEQQRRWLEPLIAGDTTLALAYAEAPSRYDVRAPATRAERSGAGWVLRGDKAWVLNGHHADHLVVSAATGDGVGLFVVDKGMQGVTVTPVATMDGQRAAMVKLDGVELGGDRLLGASGAGELLADVVDLGAVAACAEGVGIMQTCLAMTVDYLKTREQFGVKIGSFQALQHRAVDMFVEVEVTRSLAIEAAIRASDDSDADERRAAISAAKAQLSVGGKFVVHEAIQLHGGIAITEEHDIGLYFKRMHVLNALFGDEIFHVQRFGNLPTFTAGIE